LSKEQLIERCKELRLTTNGSPKALRDRIIQLELRNWPELELSTPDTFLSQFSGKPGLSDWRKGKAKAGSLFLMLFTEEELSYQVEETNRYAPLRATELAKSSGALPKNSKKLLSGNEVWQYGGELTVAELKLVMAIFFVMGLSSCPEVKDYWSDNAFYQNAWIKQKMSRNRYEEINRYLHICPPTKPEGAGKDWKVSHLIKTLNKQFKSFYLPTQNIAIDEAMCAFTGRLGFLQYCPGKPNPWGIKLWLMVDKNGFIWHIEV
jgi:Transposase IS4